MRNRKWLGKLEELSNYEKKKYKKKRIVFQASILIILIASAITAIIILFPYFQRAAVDNVYREELIESLRSYGGWTWIILLFAQIIQTVLAIIPASPVTLITGVLLNPFAAVAVTAFGQVIGILIIIYLVKIFGYSFLALFIDPDQPKKIKLFADEKRCEIMFMSYIFIPSLPKDPLAFIVPFTKVKPYRFAIIFFIARLPMTISTVLFSDSFATGNYVAVIIIGGISLTLGLLGIIFNKKIVALLDKKVTDNHT